MRIVDGTLCWSATDLTTAASCEHALLRQLDELLGRGDPRPRERDLLVDQIARVGQLHEAGIRTRLETQASRFLALDPAPPCASAARLHAMHAATVAALHSGADVVYQAGFFDGEIVGFADFLVASPRGWVVSDAKLARQARATALLQLGAYADLLQRTGVQVAPCARLLLGDGSEEDFPLSEVLPVYRERRARLRRLLGAHVDSPEPVRWDDGGHVACGQCPDCRQAIDRHRDVLLVAGVRMTQRKLLRKARIGSIDDLAAATEPPDRMPPATFARLAAQARLQLAQLGGGKVSYELVDGGRALTKLPAPSRGDIFFDFEGDPLHREADPRTWGLEYLWGVIEAPVGDRSPRYTRWWAHDRAQERAALVGFMEYVAARRRRYPEMHIYHYAPYETAALKRLVGRCATHQTELDDLLRSAVFVDLYSMVRASVRVSQPSYSLKKLEPLYMGEDDRGGMEVQAGDASVSEYHEAMALRSRGSVEEAERRLAALEAYNRYDCVSTLRLRDWLLELAADNDLAGGIHPAAVEESGEESEEADHTFRRLRARSGPGERTARSADEQCHAMLASALGFHRRETLPFWWEHFARLATPDLHDWRPDRDVFRVSSHELLEDWHVPAKKQVLHRRMRLRGAWGAGSTPGTRATAVYRVPCPEGHRVPEKCSYGWMPDRAIEVSREDENEVVLVETLRKGAQPFDAVPVALVPSPPPHDGVLRTAIREVAEAVVQRAELPAQPALDILRRVPPRMGSGSLPHTGDAVGDLVSALLHLDRSYVPVQGPPGTGKTHTGSRVVKRLVEEHGWRIGVVSQSHAVVENMLAAICGAGLDPSLVAKKATRNRDHAWVDLDTRRDRDLPAFLQTHATSGCVIGGTAWTFAGENAVERECLDLLVVDEAGQFALANTVAVSVAAKRLLLLGDPRQLPQVSQGTHDEPVDESALGWVMGSAETLPRELGYFLATTYRMHPALCQKVSRHSYGGQLHAADCTRERLLEGVDPGLQTVLVEDASGNSVRSEEEAAVVVAQVERLLGTPWRGRAGDMLRPLGEADILVVAPYNAQVQLLSQLLRARGHGAVRVGTVDRFQGQEAPVVIVSMTASSPDDVPRGMGFLLSRNRVNVAISRAQWLAVLVRSKELTSYLPSSPERLLELGGFIGLAEDDGGCSEARRAAEERCVPAAPHRDQPEHHAEQGAGDGDHRDGEVEGHEHDETLSPLTTRPGTGPRPGPTGPVAR